MRVRRTSKSPGSSRHWWSFCFGILVITSSVAQPCRSDLRLQAATESSREVAQKRRAVEIFTYRWIAQQQEANNRGPEVSARSVIRIPVVIHIIWQDPEENIPEEQVFSQLAVLNEDFRLLNDLSVIPANFLPLAADPELEFCLAQRTPQGEATSGITRTQTTINNVGTARVNGQRAVFYSDLGGVDAWAPEEYLNIWVGRRQFANGEASFPGQSEPEEDGIVIDPRYFGRVGSVAPPYDLGRTLTHEIGHYFNLHHLWGPNTDSGCTEDDGVADTPLQSVTYLNTCPSSPQFSCGTSDMYMNYMNFTDDACMGMFTTGQKLRMLAALNGPRAGLLLSQGCLPPTGTNATLAGEPAYRIYPNPAGDNLVVRFTDPALHAFVFEICDASGRTILREPRPGPGEFTVDLSHLPAGAYFTKFRSGENMITKKLIIVR